MDRRNFLVGLAALAAVVSLPALAEAEPAWIKFDFGPAEQRIMAFYINGKPMNIVGVSDDGVMWTECSLEAGDLVAGRYYKLELKHAALGEEPVYAEDVQLVSDQRISEPVEGKLKRLFGWRTRGSAEENRYGLVGDDGSTFILTPKARNRSFFASDHG